jgi:hypothetical protein
VAINRLRHYYLEIAPELGAHLTLSPFDDMAGVLASVGSVRTRMRPWDLVISNAGLIGVIDALISGILAGLAAWSLTGNEPISGAAAFAVGLVVLAALLSYSRGQLRTAQAAIGVRFATGAGIDTSHVRGGENVPSSTTGGEA